MEIRHSNGKISGPRSPEIARSFPFSSPVHSLSVFFSLHELQTVASYVSNTLQHFYSSWKLQGSTVNTRSGGRGNQQYYLLEESSQRNRNGSTWLTRCQLRYVALLSLLRLKSLRSWTANREYQSRALPGTQADRRICRCQRNNQDF